MNATTEIWFKLVELPTKPGVNARHTFKNHGHHVGNNQSAKGDVATAFENRMSCRWVEGLKNVPPKNPIGRGTASYGLHNGPGQTQHLTPPCDEQVPGRFLLSLAHPSSQIAVASSGTSDT